MKRLIRLPRPDFTTSFATRKAIATSSTLALENPPNAVAGETEPVSTTAPTASIVEVSSGNAPTNTDAIAETKTANRCQAGEVSPAGTGVSQIPAANTNTRSTSPTRRLTLTCRKIPETQPRPKGAAEGLGAGQPIPSHH
jgi:hypothetical protein